MKYEEALRVMSDAASLAAMPKHAHLQVEQAYKVLDELIKQQSKNEDKKKGETE